MGRDRARQYDLTIYGEMTEGLWLRGGQVLTSPTCTATSSCNVSEMNLDRSNLDRSNLPVLLETIKSQCEEFASLESHAC